MEDSEIGGILRELGSPESEGGWTAFLDRFSPFILQVVKLFEREPDLLADCFLYVCEQLSQSRFRRLRGFRADGRASFTTWLRAVVRNLCLDWHRKEFGRHRVFENVAPLNPLERSVFSAVYERGLSEDEALAALRVDQPELTPAEFDESLKRLRQVLTPRQLWLLGARRPKVESLSGESGEEGRAEDREIPDTKPNPESLALAEERRRALERALAKLSSSEGLLLRLRFEQGLKLREVADLLGLKDAQTADRRVREVLDKLRRELSPEPERDGKTDPASV